MYINFVYMTPYLFTRYTTTKLSSLAPLPTIKYPLIDDTFPRDRNEGTSLSQDSYSPGYVHRDIYKTTPEMTFPRDQHPMLSRSTVYTTFCLPASLVSLMMGSSPVGVVAVVERTH